MICVLENRDRSKINYLQVFEGIITDEMAFVVKKTYFYIDLRSDYFRGKAEDGVKRYVNRYYDNKSDCIKELVPFIFKHEWVK